MAPLRETYVLSPRILKKTSGVSCRTSVSKFHGNCVVYLHWKFQQTPIIEKRVLVTPEICNKAWREGVVTLPDLTILRLELGHCLQAECLQGEDKEFKHGGEAYSLNHLLKEAEDGLVNPFSKLRDVWDKYAAVILTFLSIQYAIMMVMLCPAFMKYGVSEFYRVLLSAVFVDLYGVRDQRNLEQELEIQIINEDKEAEVKAEEMLKVFLEGDEVSNMRLEDEDFLLKTEGYTKRKKDEVTLGRIKRQKEDEI